MILKEIKKKFCALIEWPKGTKKKLKNVILSYCLFGIYRPIQRKFRDLYDDQDVVKMVFDQNLGALKRLINKPLAFTTIYVSVASRLVTDCY